MQRALEGTPTAELQREALRRSAMAAATDSGRTLWVAGLALAATLGFGLAMVFMPNLFGLTGQGLDALRALGEQSRRLPSAELSSERLQTLAQPFWLLLGRYSSDIGLAGLILSGISAIVALFMAYQLAHGLALPEHADEQATYALLGLALTPTFFVAAAGGGGELPHLALILWALVCAQRASQSEKPLVPMALAGLFFGLSLLIRPISLLVPVAVLLWLAVVRPFEQTGRLKPLLGFFAAYAIGGAPTLVLHWTYHTSPVSWGPAELGALFGRLAADPLRFLLAIGQTIVQYVAADDLERLGGVSGTWLAGDWLGVPGAMIALAPTLLKLLGLLGAGCLLWLERFESGSTRSRLPLMLVGVFVLGGALGVVEERSLLLLGAVLAIFAFAGLPALSPGAVGGIASLATVGFLVFYQFGGAHVARLSPLFRGSDRVADELRIHGATAGQTMSASWSYYDTRSPLKERYHHIPAYVDSTESLIREMRRQNVRYLVFDRTTGAAHWPKLAGLLETDQHPPFLRPLGPALSTAESPPNIVAIYQLD